MTCRQSSPFPLRSHWSLEPGRVFLNHGSYGACPTQVLEVQSELRARLERSPGDFFGRQYRPLLREAGERLAEFLGARSQQLAWVTNATSGVNAVLNSLPWSAGDQLLLTDHGYRACANAARYLSERLGVELVEVALPFPTDPVDIQQRVLAALTPRTRLAMLDHISSPTATIFPVAELAEQLAARGIKVLIDGAHAPGMLELDLRQLGARGVTYYTGNLHKWCCAPKGSAFLWVAEPDQRGLHPPVISHGFSIVSAEAIPFWEEFHWSGTFDPTAWLAAPAALSFLGSLFPGGWEELRAHCRQLLQQGQKLVLEVLPVSTFSPLAGSGQMVSLQLPDCDPDQLHRELYDEYGIDTQVFHWGGRTLLRLSAAVYNTTSDYHSLAAALKGLASQRDWS